MTRFAFCLLRSRYVVQYKSTVAYVVAFHEQRSYRDVSVHYYDASWQHQTHKEPLEGKVAAPALRGHKHVIKLAEKFKVHPNKIAA